MSKEQSTKTPKSSSVEEEEGDKPLMEKFQEFKADSGDKSVQVGSFYDSIERSAERRFNLLYQQGYVFATMEEFERTHVDIKANEWDSLKESVWRSELPDFKCRHFNGDKQNPREFVATIEGARLEDSVLPPLSAGGSKDTSTKVNDDVIPVDIFGDEPDGTNIAHLLPKARGDATTWNYPACAVLGLPIMGGKDTVFQKVVLGCKTTKTTMTDTVRYPGIRNMVSNLVRVSGQFFDRKPFLCIFPIYDLEEAKDWKGDGYEAIVVCANPHVAKKIGMTSVPTNDAKVANVTEINKAVGLASTLCKFLAHSVLEKNKQDVDKYQRKNKERENAHAKFRDERKIEVPRPLTSSTPSKPFFKISFEKHDAKEGQGHPAPDPMLLAFKSCNNWCQRFSGFRMVAAAEPEDSNDEWSEEGKQNLRAYVEWQAEQEKSLRHDEIMNLFGDNGKGVETTAATAIM